jgi:hypothetical protein
MAGTGLHPDAAATGTSFKVHGAFNCSGPQVDAGTGNQVAQIQPSATLPLAPVDAGNDETAGAQGLTDRRQLRPAGIARQEQQVRWPCIHCLG